MNLATPTCWGCYHIFSIGVSLSLGNDCLCFVTLHVLKSSCVSFFQARQYQRCRLVLTAVCWYLVYDICLFISGHCKCCILAGIQLCSVTVTRHVIVEAVVWQECSVDENGRYMDHAVVDCLRGCIVGVDADDAGDYVTYIYNVFRFIIDADVLRAFLNFFM